MKTQDLKKLAKQLGITGVALTTVCCILPLTGIVITAGTASVLLPFLEYTGVIIAFCALALLGIYLIRRKNASFTCSPECSPESEGSTEPSQSILNSLESALQQSGGDHPIACDLSVFNEEEREAHIPHSKEVLYNAPAIYELNDGFAFQHPYSPEKFMSIARWITQENKCCPFLVFELALQPLDEGYAIWLKLRGSREIKEYLGW